MILIEFSTKLRNFYMMESELYLKKTTVVVFSELAKVNFFLISFFVIFSWLKNLHKHFVTSVSIFMSFKVKFLV